ncbi:hypothetical protein BaRGS_00006558 [Batillaria attramentaria]|uniref:SOCS box domain-containing protein n=1 Tax=Batillaria attramentaria TaxID=370345 RepID=A0ABD0LT55_9CAEN
MLSLGNIESVLHDLQQGIPRRHAHNVLNLVTVWNDLREAVRNDQVPFPITDLTVLRLCRGETSLDALDLNDINRMVVADHVDLFHFGLLDRVTSESTDNKCLPETLSCGISGGCSGTINRDIPFFLGLCIPNPCSGNPYRFTVLHIAALLGQDELCRGLVQRGASLLQKDVRGNTALMLALASGHPTLASTLISLCPREKVSEFVNARNVNGMTALHFAVAFGRHSMVDVLLSLGANVNGDTPDEVPERYARSPTPLHLAIAADHHEGNVNLTSKLLELGADQTRLADIPHVVHVPPAGQRLLVSEGRSSLAVTVLALGAAYLTDRYNPSYGTLGKGTPFHWAVRLGAVTCIRRLLEDVPADLEGQTSDGATPLMVACRFAVTESVRELIKQGARLNVSDRLGATPVHYLILAHGLDCRICPVRERSDGEDCLQCCAHYQTACTCTRSQMIPISAVHDTLDWLLDQREKPQRLSDTKVNLSAQPVVRSVGDNNRAMFDAVRTRIAGINTLDTTSVTADETHCLSETGTSGSVTADGTRSSCETGTSGWVTVGDTHGSCGTRTSGNVTAEVETFAETWPLCVPSLVQYAVLSRAPSILLRLIQAGEDFTSPDASGVTPMMCAAGLRACPETSLLMAKVLVQHGAATFEPRVLNLNWKHPSPAGLAFFYSDHKLLELLNHSGGLTPAEVSEMLDYLGGVRFQDLGRPFRRSCSRADMLMVGKLEVLAGQPRSLSDLCRLEIVHTIGARADHVTQLRRLPLPSLIQKSLELHA